MNTRHIRKTENAIIDLHRLMTNTHKVLEEYPSGTKVCEIESAVKNTESDLLCFDGIFDVAIESEVPAQVASDTNKTQIVNDKDAQDNFILNDIDSIDTGLRKLHLDETTFKDLKGQHKEDIRKHKEKVEADHNAALAAVDESERIIEDDYQKQLRASTDAKYFPNTNATVKIDAIRAKYDKIIKSDNALIKDLTEKCKIAADNNDSLLKKYGVIPNRNTVKPNLDIMFALFDRIMTDTAQSFIKRTFKKDGFYAQNDMVRDFIKLAANAISYLNYEINEVIPNDCNAEIQREMSSATQVHSDLLAENKQKRREVELKYQNDLADVARLEQRHIAEESIEAANVEKRKEAFFTSDLVAGFTSRITQALQDSGSFDADWKHYNIDRPVGSYFAWGDMNVPIYTGSRSLVDDLATRIPDYARSGYFAVPFLFKTEMAYKMYIHYNAATKNTAYSNVQAFILQKMRSNPANRLQVYFADPNDRGQNLGVLIAPNETNEQIGIFARNTQSEINSLLKEIETHIDTANGIIGDCQSIYEYNAKNENKLKELIIVLCDVQDCITYNDIAKLKVIWENAERYGINIILTSEIIVDYIEQCYENKNIDFAFLRHKSPSAIMYDVAKNFISFGKNSYSYTATTVDDAHKDFVAGYRNQFVESLKLNNKFQDIRQQMLVDCETEEQKQYGKSIKSVKLPVLINTDTNKIDRDFEIGTSNDVHMLVTGGTGSGKSRLLFSIIASIAMNYHPDDVELWLVDCKINEFKPFIDKYRLPHIRMVALERTEEFCRAFFKYLSEVVAERVRLFGEAGKKSFDEYRKAMNDPYCMPRIIIVVDEFHALIQVLNDDRNLKNEMENALAEYRSYGISFIFSDQSYEKITMSLQQVNCRIALRGDVENMKQTLRLKGDFTEELASDFKQSEGKGDAWWGAKLPTRFKNVHLHESEEEAFFEEMADKWRPQIITPKQPIFINGKQRYPYDDNMAMSAIKEKQAQLDAFDDYQMDLVLGQPTTFDPYFSFCLKQGRRENLLLLGESEMSLDVIGAIIKSLQHNGPIRIIAIGDRSDNNFKKFRRYASNNSLDNVEIYYDYEDICNIVYEFNQQVQKKKEFSTKTIVFWFALNSICEELGDFPQRKVQEEQNAETPEQKEKNVVSEEEMKKMLAVAAEVASDEFDPSGLFQNADLEPEPVVPKPVANDEDNCYNASDDILNLFASGSRFGLFNVVMLENPSDEQQIKGVAKRWEDEQFKHKIGFCMSRSNAANWHILEASDLEENMTAFYTDGIKKNVFKPYYTVNKEE